MPWTFNPQFLKSSDSTSGASFCFSTSQCRTFNFDRISSKVSADLPSSLNFQISTYRAIWSDDLPKFETLPLRYLRVKFCSLRHFRMKISLPRIIRGNVSKVTAQISNWRRNSLTVERTALELQSFKNRPTRVPDWTLDCVTQSRNQRTKRHANDLLAADSRRFTKYSPDTRDSIALANVPAN